MYLKYISTKKSTECLVPVNLQCFQRGVDFWCQFSPEIQTANSHNWNCTGLEFVRAFVCVCVCVRDAMRQHTQLFPLLPLFFFSPSISNQIPLASMQLWEDWTSDPIFFFFFLLSQASHVKAAKLVGNLYLIAMTWQQYQYKAKQGSSKKEISQVLRTSFYETVHVQILPIALQSSSSFYESKKVIALRSCPGRTT